MVHWFNTIGLHILPTRVFRLGIPQPPSMSSNHHSQFSSQHEKTLLVKNVNSLTCFSSPCSPKLMSRLFKTKQKMIILFVFLVSQYHFSGGLVDLKKRRRTSQILLHYVQKEEKKGFQKLWGREVESAKPQTLLEIGWQWCLLFTCF